MEVRGNFPHCYWSAEARYDQLRLLCHGAPEWYGCTEKAWLQNTTMVQTSKSTSCDPPSFPCFCSHPWSPQHLLFPRMKSLAPSQSMKIFETRGRNNTDIILLFSQNTQMPICIQQLFWWEKKAVIWLPLYPSCAPHWLYSSNTCCSPVGGKLYESQQWWRQWKLGGSKSPSFSHHFHPTSLAYKLGYGYAGSQLH